MIAGGGVAALEALLAIRELLDETVDIELVSASREFVYRPVTVTEPFGMGEAQSFDLAAIAGELHAELRIDSVAEVDSPTRVVRTAGGAAVPYDALLVATGARPRSWLPGAVTFRGRMDGEALRDVLRDLDAGQVRRIAFVGVPGESWLLPLYELALLTAAHVADERLSDVELLLVTPEDAPLGLFGPRASAAVRQLLADRGIELHAATYAARLQDGCLHVVPEGRLRVDRAVTLPILEGIRLAGLPQDDRGFINTDEHGRVAGLDDVYAAGDGTAFPVKQGGLAAQQADAAVEAIAARFGVGLEPRPFTPVLRGMLLTGLGPTYLRSDISGRTGDDSEADTQALWWPPEKIAGQRLAPYLSHRMALGRPDGLSDRSAHEAFDPAGPAHRAARDLVLALADAEGGWGHYDEAVKALDAAVALDGTLPPEYVEKRRRWRAGEPSPRRSTP